MSINPGEEGNIPDLSPFFIGKASPNLSPFLGSLSPILSIDDQAQFRLENYEEQESEHNNDFYSPAPLPQDLLLIEEHCQQELLGVRQLQKDEKIQRNIYESQMKAEAASQYTFSFHHQQSKTEKHQVQTPTHLPIGSNSSKVYAIIQFLVINLQKFQNQSLLTQNSNRDSICNGEEKYIYIFDVLFGKFKKLKKTKEQMIKFSMRKAFKYISDLKNSEQHHTKSKKSKKLNNSQQNVQNQNLFTDIPMPFRKNSSQKTMNNQFLKQTFSNQFFRHNYHYFLQNLPEIVEQDNQSKIKYLADMIETMISKNQIQGLQRVKRLPWTKRILDKVQDLAKTLLRDFGRSENECSVQVENQQEYGRALKTSLSLSENHIDLPQAEKSSPKKKKGKRKKQINKQIEYDYAINEGSQILAE